MGDFEVSLHKQNGEFGEQSTSAAWPLEPLNPLPQDIPVENWRVSEQMTRLIIWKIQPTRVSEERRRIVVDYVQQLVGRLLGSEVFPFGSVPLKTYLPDGDIDLTALGIPNYEDYLAAEVRSVLEREEQNKACEFEVKDVQYIHAEVKLVKCLVQNIVVDISFNQIGGLRTLCFLDEVDDIIGKNNLFKRTIILIKAWCYYESRILGAHHSLISTYALETLVLYIFNLFHSSLDGPLAVLYRFLEYFSKFDWDNYCISLRGPVHISSLPDIVVEVAEIDGSDLLLSTDFLNKCSEKYSITSKFPESNNRFFVKKYLNIVDPLKENNNLGRSVSKGNLYRIRSAFAYGARKLGRILLLHRESMSNELNKFFKNTLERHGNGERPDVQVACSGHFEENQVTRISPNNDTEKFTEHDNTPLAPTHGNSLGGHYNSNDTNFPQRENGKEIQAVPPLLNENHLQRHIKSETSVKDGNSMSDSYLTDGIASRTPGSNSLNEKHGDPSTPAESSTQLNRVNHAPHQFFCNENWNASAVEENAGQHVIFDDSPSHPNDSELSSNRSLLRSLNQTSDSIIINGGQVISNENLESSSICSSTADDGILDFVSSETDLVVEDKIPDAYDLANLSGNPELHYKNFQYAQRSHEFLNMPLSPGNLRSPPHYPIQAPIFPHINGYIPSPPYPHAPSFYQMNPGFIPRVYGLDDLRKPRGTGTYIPNPNANTNHRVYKDRTANGRGKHQFFANQTQRPRNNGRTTPPECNSPDARGSPVFGGNGRGKSSHLEFPQFSNIPRGFPHSNGNIHPVESQLQFGTLDPAPLGSSTPESGRIPESNSPHSHTSPSNLQKSSIILNNERLVQGYRLKDDEEFPPLSVGGNQHAPNTFK